MQKRKMNELISYFNRKVADMDIKQTYKMELLGMITAIGIANEKESAEPHITMCKDCEYYYYAGNRIPSEREWICGRTGDPAKQSDYCSWAEPKEEGEEDD